MDEENSKQEEETGRFSIKCLGGLMITLHLPPVSSR